MSAGWIPGPNVFKSPWKKWLLMCMNICGPSEYTITGTLKNYERANDLKNITIPTLFTCGRYDEASPESTTYYQSMLPGSRIVIFEDASHSHHLEQEAAYLNTVREFLSSGE